MVLLVATLLVSFTAGAAEPLASLVAQPDFVASPKLEVLVERVRQSRVVVIGEQHRTKEPVALLRALMTSVVADGTFHVIALEGQEDQQVHVDRYLAGHATGEGALRATLLHPELAQVLVEAKRLNDSGALARPVRVLLIDGPSAWNLSRLEQSRDQAMFAHLRRVLDADPSARVLVYVGNAHTTEGVQLLDGYEGPGHQEDAFVLPGFRVAHLLELYTGGKSLSVRTVGPEDALGRALEPRFGKAHALYVPIDDGPLAPLTGLVEPGGSWNAALAQAPLGAVTDFVVAFDRLSPAPRWSAKAPAASPR